jgi:hypothetical protein
METVMEAMESMEMTPGPFPHPGRVSEQRLLSPRISLVAAAELRDFF